MAEHSVQKQRQNRVFAALCSSTHRHGAVFSSSLSHVFFESETVSVSLFLLSYKIIRSISVCTQCRSCHFVLTGKLAAKFLVPFSDFLSPFVSTCRFMFIVRACVCTRTFPCTDAYAYRNFSIFLKGLRGGCLLGNRLQQIRQT